MININYEQFIEILKKYDNFDEKTLNAMYHEFGKDRIDRFFEEYSQKVDEKELPLFIKKYSAYFDMNSFEDDSIYSSNIQVGSIVSMIVNNALQYKMMNSKEEYEQGMNLKKSKESLMIVKELDNTYILYPNLDIEKIFMSVKTKEDIEAISSIKKIPYSLGDESIFKDEIAKIKKFLKIDFEQDSFVDRLKKEFANLCFDNVTPVDNLVEQIDLLKTYVTAKFNLYNRNLRLVISISNRMCKNITQEDRIQEGNIGLIRAINKFDVSKGYKFSTYATWWIKQYVSRYSAENCSLIRKPVYLSEKIRKYKSFVSKYMLDYGFEPTLDTCSEELGMSPEVIMQLQELSLDIVSLNTHAKGMEDGDEIINMIGDDSISIEESFISSILVENIVKEIESEFSSRDRLILLNRLGINEKEEIFTLQEIGEQLGLTRERVRQIEEKSKIKLKNKLKRHGFV